MMVMGLENTKLVHETGGGVKMINYVSKCLIQVNKIGIQSREGEGRGSGEKTENKATSSIIEERPYS